MLIHPGTLGLNLTGFEMCIRDRYDGLQRIIVCTNSNLIAPKNYESVGFKLYNRKENNTESAYTGAYLYYSMNL